MSYSSAVLKLLQNTLILIKSNLSVFYFVECSFGVISKNSLTDSRLHRFSSVFSSKSFKV